MTLEQRAKRVNDLLVSFLASPSATLLPAPARAALGELALFAVELTSEVIAMKGAGSEK